MTDMTLRLPVLPPSSVYLSLVSLDSHQLGLLGDDFDLLLDILL